MLFAKFMKSENTSSVYETHLAVLTKSWHAFHMCEIHLIIFTKSEHESIP